MKGTISTSGVSGDLHAKETMIDFETRIDSYVMSGIGYPEEQ